MAKAGFKGNRRLGCARRPGWRMHCNGGARGRRGKGSGTFPCKPPAIGVKAAAAAGRRAWHASMQCCSLAACPVRRGGGGWARIREEGSQAHRREAGVLEGALRSSVVRAGGCSACSACQVQGGLVAAAGSRSNGARMRKKQGGGDAQRRPALPRRGLTACADCLPCSLLVHRVVCVLAATTGRVYPAVQGYVHRSVCGLVVCVCLQTSPGPSQGNAPWTTTRGGPTGFRHADACAAAGIRG